MITVNSISFSNTLRPSQPTTNRLVGNAGDVVVAIINLTSTSAINDFAFYVNAVPNTQQIYSDALSGGIFSSAFNSLTTNVNQFYLRNGSTISPITGRFDTNISLALNNVSGFEYNLVHTFILAPFLRENELDIDTFENPSYFDGTGLKYVFKLDSLVAGSIQETTDDVNLETTNIIRNGAVSGWGSSLGTGAINYELVTPPNLNNLNSNVVSTITAQIKKLSGAWLTSDLISYRLQEISEISSYNFNQSLLQNTKFDFVTHNVEDAPQDGANGFILDCFCEIDGADNTLLNVTFSIVDNYTEEFAVFFACSSDSLDLEHQNVLATYGTASVQGSDSQVEFVNYAGFNQNFRIGFVNWYNQTFINEGFNHLRAYRKDDNEVFFGVRLTNVDARFVSLECGFKDLNTNQFITNEIFNFDFTTNVPFVLDRGYIRKSDNPKKLIQVAFVGDRYQFRYGFNVGSEFLISDNIVFEANVNFVDSNGFALTNTIRSPKLEIGQYDVTQNTVAEPQVLASPIPQPKFYLVDGSNTPDFTTEFDGLIAGSNMFIEATFQDNNLNDLQANEEDLAGFFTITTPNEIKEIERYFFSTYQSETDTPFEAINGHTAGLVKVTKIDVKTVTLSAIINYDRLVKAFPNLQDLCIVSRIDKPQPPLNPFYREISFHFTQPNGTRLICNAATENFIQQKWFSDGNTDNADFQFKINTTGVTDLNDASWGLIPYISVAQFEEAAILTGYTIRVEYIGSGLQTDILGKIEYISLVPTVTPFVGTHTRLSQTAANDFMAFYTEPLSLTEFTATNTNRFHNVRTDLELANSSDLTDFTAYNIATLNSNLASSPQPYAHFFLAPTTLANTTTTVRGNFGSANREVIEYVSPSKYAFYPITGNQTNVLSFRPDGINDIAEVAGLPTKNALDFAQIPDGRYINIDFTVRANQTFGSQRCLVFVSGSGSNTSLAQFIVSVFNNGTSSSSVGILFQNGSSNAAGGFSIKVVSFPCIIVQGQVYKISISVQKIGNTNSIFTDIANPICTVNNRFVQGVLSQQSSGIPLAPLPVLTGRLTNALEIGTATILQPPVLVTQRMKEFGISISDNPLTRKEMTEYHRGQRLVNSNQYAWDFSNLTAPNIIPAIGTTGTDNVVIANLGEPLQPLF